MKRILLVSAVIMVFSSSVLGAPVGNIANPVLEESEPRIKIGVESDFVLERELDVSNESVEIETNFHSAKIAYTLADKVDVYALVGTISGAEVTEKEGSNTYKYSFDDDLAWGLGVTASLYEFDNGFKIGIDGKYRSSEVDLTEIDVNGTSYGVSDISNIAGDYKEWQVALGVSREFGETTKFVPYLGVKYSDVEVQAKGTISGTTYETDKINSKDTIGMFVGTQLILNDRLDLNIEGRFIDETAVSASLTYRF